MRGLFQWLDAHPVFYWTVFAAALLAWVVRCRALGARHAAGGEDSDRVSWLALIAVLVAGRWPELLAARGVMEEEARVVLGALGLAEEVRPFRAFVFEGAGPVSSAALLPTHWLGIPQDYFNLRLVALGCDLVTVSCMWRILRQRQGADLAAWAGGVLALFLAGPWSERWAGALAMHLLLALTAVAAVLIAGGRERRDAGIDFAAAMAGLTIAMMPWVHREGRVWAVVCVAAGAAWSRDASRIRWLAGATVYGAAVATAFVWGTGGWADFWDGYVLGLSRGTSLSAWWSGFGLLVVGAGGSVVLAGWSSGAVRGAKAGGAALSVAILGAISLIAYGPPGMLGSLTEHWRHPRTELANQLRTLARPQEHIAAWGPVSSALVEARLRPVTPFGVVDQSDWQWQRRWFEAVRRQEAAVLVVAADQRSERLRALLQDRYRIAWSGPEGEIHLSNERMHVRVMQQPGVMAITVGELISAEAFGGVSEIGTGRLATHAPSRLVAWVPAETRRVAGIFGFYPDAYRHPGRTTDGGKFSVAWLREGGRTREAVTERWLTPAQKSEDRGVHEFSFEIPPGVEAVEFKVETGASMSFDWGFWGDLRFESARPAR